MNGLDLNLEQFAKMSAKDRDLVIFKNLVHIRKDIGDRKFHRKIAYAWLLALTGAMGLKRYMGL